MVGFDQHLCIFGSVVLLETDTQDLVMKDTSLYHTQSLGILGDAVEKVNGSSLWK